jgi:hypothetical protein
MNNKLDFQVRLWPWSCVADEIIVAKSGSLEFIYYGSPLLIVAEGIDIILPIRYEQLKPHGPFFSTSSGKFRLYEAPHGILASKSQQSSTQPWISLTKSDKYEHIFIKSLFAKKEDSIEDYKSSLAAIVRSWSTFFDDCIDNIYQNNKKNDNMMNWDDILPYINKLRDNEQHEPRMALIVHLAEEMKIKLAEIVYLARKILLRMRELLPAGRVAELDGTCLHWFSRQPGETSAQKAAANKQRLLGVARKESFDTLENRVLMDFIYRCKNETHRYQNTEVGTNYQNSYRARVVRQYQHICAALSKNYIFNYVAKLSSRVKPNYVLQNDLHYRFIWHNYQRLLRQEDEKDRSWDWQSRTWADLVRLMFNTALCSMPYDFVKPVMKSSLRFSKEQVLGQRLVAGTEPGPFILFSTNGKPQWILEAVHPDQAAVHPIVMGLGRFGGHLYYVINKIDSIERRVLIIWSIHCSSSTIKPDWIKISASAANALKHHSYIINDHNTSSLKFYGLVAASDDQQDDGDFEIADEDLPVLRLPTDYRRWATSISCLVLPLLRMKLEEMCS